MIHVRKLTKTYNDIQSGQFKALAGISFDAMPGQIYGLLGPNGAGKTTALRILSTVLKPTNGSAVVNGFNVNEQPEQVRRQIGFVSCNTAIYDLMGTSPVLWTNVRHAVGTPEYKNECSVRPVSDERNPRCALQQNVDWHEAESFHRQSNDSQSAGSNF